MSDFASMSRLSLGRVLECGWCGEVVVVYGDMRVSYWTGAAHVHLRLVKGETA